MTTQDRIIQKVKEERQRQDAKWGKQKHDPITWLVILTEEIGEAAQEALEYKFSKETDNYRLDLFKEEIIQVAAVAVSILESLENKQ